jgi:hypothetical protein
MKLKRFEDFKLIKESVDANELERLATNLNLQDYDINPEDVKEEDVLIIIANRNGSYIKSRVRVKKVNPNSYDVWWYGGMIDINKDSIEGMIRINSDEEPSTEEIVAALNENLNESVLQKDLDRMHSILKKSGDDKEKMRNYVEAMAKAIKDKHKAFQRGKAADEVLKDQELANIFYHRAQELGLDFDINVERSKTGMSKFGIEVPKLGSRKGKVHDEKHRNRINTSIASLGSVNIQTGKSRYFNVYETWREDDTVVEVWKKDENGSLILVFGSGTKPMVDIGGTATFRDYNSGREITYHSTLIEWVLMKDLKELLRIYNKKSFTGYTYK